MRKPERSFFLRPAEELAPVLIGSYLYKEDEEKLLARIVEVEAYLPDDPASHSYKGRGIRNAAMFEEGGTAYVYTIYGIHHCLNLVCGPPSYAGAVLLRALEPKQGLELMWQRRFPEKKYNSKDVKKLCNGPGRLCEAFSIQKELHDKTSLIDGPLFLFCEEGDEESKPSPNITFDYRIGIKKAVDKKLRFFETGNPYISRPAIAAKIRSRSSIEK